MRRMWRMLMSASGVMTIVTPAIAQEIGSAPQQSGAVGDIIVSAQRSISDATHLDAPIKDLPIAIQSVPAQLIEDQGFQRLGDAIRNVSGVVRKEAYLGVTDSFGIRGFDAQTGLLNGFRHSFYDTAVDLVHVDRIEVIKGPASVSTGYIEPGGVVSIVTKAPTEVGQSEIALTAGSYGKYRVQGDVSQPLSSTLGIRLTGADDRGENFREHIDPRKWTVGGALTWRITPFTTLDLRGYYLHIVTTPDRGFDPDSLGLIAFRLPPSRFLGEPGDRYRVDANDLSAVLNHDLGGGWSMRTGVERNRNTDRREATQTTDLETDGRTVNRQFTRVRSPETFLNGFAELHGSFDTFGLHHRLVAGVDGNRITAVNDFRRYDTVAPIDIFAPVYAGKAAGLPPRLRLRREVTDDLGGYAQDLISLAKRWKLLAGLRFDHFRDRVEDHLTGAITRFGQNQTTPRIGLIFEPAPAVRLYANYARSFNPQTSTTLRGGSPPAPEQGEQVEGGIKYVMHDGRLTVSAAVYQITKRNVATPDPADPDFAILAGQERSRGLEFDLSAKPLDQLQIVTSYAYTDAVVTRDEAIPVGDRLLNVPHHQASFWTRYDPPALPLGVGVGVFYVGQREAYLPNTFRIPDYLRADAALYGKLGTRVELAVNVQNLTDRRYYDSQNSYLYPGAPRTVLATLRLRS
ncbi:TonB-dependent siderophore receptor [Sphingomonas sp. 8AM]|uniref:TonB-dependent siderophore receptor n=1 Tax=Sphingomonas sp. 8AM TaxID=2653170 RepID=UPI0012F40F4D|nr:TonB-dependent siderophore receptor [Sphingomonas sp. 8AM]VXC99443.1 putative TonB-dependent siderophore receptor [Sphingomonas sp. 8AM]